MASSAGTRGSAARPFGRAAPLPSRATILTREWRSSASRGLEWAFPRFVLGSAVPAPTTGKKGRETPPNRRICNGQ